MPLRAREAWLVCVALALALASGCGRIGFRSSANDVDGARADAAGVDGAVVLEDGGRLDGAPSVDSGLPPPPCMSGASPCVSRVVDQASSGLAHVCSIDTSALRCWGLNENAALGACGVGGVQTRPYPVASGFVDVSAGEFHTCAVRADGTLHCWGSNYQGESGQPGGEDITRPTQVGTFTDWIDVEARRYSVCGLREGGSLHCWGRNDNGQLGLGIAGPLEGVFQPTAVEPGSSFVQVAMGSAHACAIRVDGALFCWGLNDRGELGVGDLAMHTRPTRVGLETDWIEVDAGKEHTCALRDGGGAYCWGQNQSGQLGVGDLLDRDVPTAVIPDTRWAHLGLGWFHSCAIRTDGAVACWGSSEHGQILGLGTGTWTPTPVLQDESGRIWRDVIGGDQHTCAVTTAGSMWCWGNNANGSLGTGDTMNRAVPTEVCFL